MSDNPDEISTQGIAIPEGLIGGYIKLDELYTQLNDAFIASCACVDLPQSA